MSQNLATTIISMVTPTLIDKVASAIGISPDLARKGLTAMLPTILGLVASRAATPSGASQLASILSNADQSIGTSAITHLSGPSHNQLSTAGSDMLGSLIGGTEASTLVDTMSRFTGTTGTAGSALAGIGTQLVMGQLARVASSQKLDASGLASLLSSQQGSIQAALPSGLSSLLANTGSFGHTFSKAASAASAAMPPKPAIATGAPRSGVASNILMWLIPVALVAAAAWYYMSNTPAPAPVAEAPAAATPEPAPAPAPAATAQEPAATPPAAAPAEQPAATAQEPAAPAVAPELPAAVMALAKPLMDSMGEATATLGKVTDAESAKAALPAIASLQTLIDAAPATLAALPADQKSAALSSLQPAFAAFKATAEKVMAIPGVGEVLKPSVEALLTKVATLSM